MLPSAVRQELCHATGFDGIVEEEMVIRMGQANDTLQGLRVALSRKAILFQGLRDATSKTNRNKSWDQIQSHHGKRTTSCLSVSLCKAYINYVGCYRGGDVHLPAAGVGAVEDHSRSD